MVFRDRAHAARLLAARLGAYRGKNALILGIPRGGVIMAALIAEELNGELDVALVTKLRAPGNPELAIGAVAETGEVFIDTRSFLGGAIPDEYRKAEVERGMQLLCGRRAAYTPARPPIDPAGRQAIVVDDGIATGSTMIVALKALGARKASRRVAAAPVAPAGASTVFQLCRRGRYPPRIREFQGGVPVL